MRSLSILLAAIGMAFAAPARADEPVAPHIRVSLQLVEVPHPTLTELISGQDISGPTLHAKACELAKTGKAKVLETCMIIARSGQKAIIESIREVIYPTEYNPPGPPPPAGQTPTDLPSKFPVTPAFRPAFGNAFETRDTGVTFEIEPTLAADNQTIDLRLAPEIVDPVELVTWWEHRDEWGDASIRFPIFEMWRTNTAITLLDGRFDLLTIFTPKPADPVPAALRKILVFVRADLVPVVLPK